MNIHSQGRWGGARVRNDWEMLRQCYSTTPKKQKPKQMFGLAEICLLLKSCLFSIITYKRKNLEFQILAAVYHKGDHGQYCYTLK